MKRMLAFLLAVLMAFGTPAAVLADSAEPEIAIELAEQDPVTEEVVEEELPAEEAAEEPALDQEAEEPALEEETAECVLERSYSPDDAAADNDSLFNNYVQKLLDESVSGEDLDLYGTAAGSRLSGDEIFFYNNLKEHVQNVASGKSIAVDFEILNGWENDYGWMANELGVDSIIENGAITDEAAQAALRKVFEKVDFNVIFDCLLADCPYDLYWMDKTNERAFSYGCSFSGNDSVITVTQFSFSFVVSENFADEDGLVDNSRVADAQQAIVTAQSLVEYHKINTDEDKLAAYAEEIKGLVSYNDDAADDDTTPYGDPWQIIYVFDGDENTNVVCEGYSKAFQYLCDLSSFEDDVVCHSVWGNMYADGEGGGHMWNVVENSNGRFLVDVTNCDGNSVGAPDKLYMVYTEGTNGGQTHTFDIGGSNVVYTYDTDMYDLICEGYPTLYQKEITPVTSGSCGDNLTWELTNDGTLTISGSGDMYDYVSLATQYSSGAPWYQYRENITSLVLDDDITHIGNYAFTGLTKIEGLLDLPNSLVTIGTEAFGNCYSLSGGLYIPDGVTSIGEMAFSKCEGMNGSLVMPDGLTTIDDYAFQFCGFTGSLVLPKALEYIGHSAFWMCKGFTGGLTIPDGIVYISPYAFNTCTGLNEEVQMGENVAGIGDFAFAGSDNIPGYRFSGVAPTEVGEDIFGTDAGMFVYFPEGAAGWTTPFWHGYVTKSYPKIVADGKCGDNLTWTLSSVGILRVEGSGAMYDFSNPYSGQAAAKAPWADLNESILMIVLDDDITYIGDYAFYNCTEVEGGLTLPGSLTAIGDYAFADCYQMSGSLVIPEGVTTIGSYAFSGAGFPGTLTIPNTVTTIGDHAFMNCNFRGDLTIPDSVTSIGEYAFTWNENLDGNLYISKNITVIPDSAFYFCENLSGSLVLPKGVTVIDENAFANCGSLTGQLIIPDGVTRIEAGAFYGCSGLSGDLTFPDSVEYIGVSAFAFCEGLDGKLTLSKNITRIMNAAFEYCSFSGDLTIPVGVSVVGSSAFSSRESRSFVGGTLTIPGTVTGIGEYAFSGCGFVGDLTLAGVMRIERYAFEGCSKLDGTVTFGVDMQVFEVGAFKDCTAVKKVVFLGDAPTQIIEATSEYSSFPSDWVLNFSAETENWTVPTWNGYQTQMMAPPTEGPFSGNLYWKLDEDGLLTISGTGRMNNCNSAEEYPWYVHKDKITSLKFEEGITVIGNKAFYDYTDLKGEVVIPASVTDIVNNAFDECTGVDAFVFAGAGIPMTQVKFASGDYRIFPKEATIYYNKNIEYWKTFYWGNWPNNWCGYTAYPRVSVVESGSHGTNHEWKVTDDGKLTIGGTGVMEDLPVASNYPWYDNLDSVTSIVIEEGVTGIPNSAFKGADGITSLELPSTLTQIGEEAFKYTGITGFVVIPAEVGIVGAGAFEGCSGVTSFVFEGNAPDVTHANSASNPSFPADAVLTYMCGTTGWTAESWNGYKTVSTGHYEATLEAVAPTCTETGLTEGKFCPDCKTIMVAQQVVPATGHSEVVDPAVEPTCTETGLTEGKHCDTCGEILIAQEIIPATGFQIIDSGECGTEGENLIWELTEDGTLTISGTGDMVDYFYWGGEAPWYHYREYITTLILEEGITHIGDFAFYICSNIAGELYIPSSVSSIGNHTFDNCLALTGSLEIPDGVISIGANAFSFCEGISGLSIGENVNNIGNNAFVGCSNIKNVCFKGNAPEVYFAGDEFRSFEENVILKYICGNNGWSYPVWRGYETIGLGHSYELWEPFPGEEENLHMGICKDCSVSCEPSPHSDDNNDGLCDACGYMMKYVPVIPDGPVVGEGEIALNKEYILMEVGEEVELTAIWQGDPALIGWTLEHAEEEHAAVGGAPASELSVMLIGVEPGTSWVTVSAETVNGVVEATCRIDVTDEDMSELTVHAGTTAVTGSLYSTNYPEIEVLFDLTHNMGLMSEDIEELSADVSSAIEDAYFVDAVAADMFMLHVLDDRTLLLIPTVDVTDAATVKAVKSSYKSAIAVVVDGVELITPEVVSIKVDKKLPTVKAGAVKLNSFYDNQTMPLVFDCKNGEVVAVELDEDNPKAKGVPCPEWLILDEENMTGSLVGDVTKASGKLYLDVYVEGYSAPVSVVVSVSAAVTAPKVKLSANKLTFNATRHNASANQVSVISGDKKVTFEDLGIIDVELAELTTPKDQKTYAAQQSYEVVDYNVETGVITINSEVPVKGKILLACEVEGSDTLINLPISVDVYTKAPTIKLTPSSITLNPNLATEDEAVAGVAITPTDLVVEDINDFEVEIIDGKKNNCEGQLDVGYANGKIMVATNDNTQPGMTYKVNIMLEGMAKPAVLSVKTVAANKSDVKLAVSAKGKLISTDPDAEVIITPKWTNFGGNVDLSENFKVYGTLKNEFTNVDFTECFDITKKADGTYSLKVKDLEAMEQLHPKATYNLAVEDVVIGGSTVAAPKPVKLSLTLTKVKVEQSTKTVNLYPNDRFSTAVVELKLKDGTLPSISVVEPVVDAKKPSAYDAKYLGNGKVEISFMNNELSKKDGSVKLNVYLDGNDSDNAQPNATVTVSVKLAKFKNK